MYTILLVTLIILLEFISTLGILIYLYFEIVHLYTFERS